MKTVTLEKIFEARSVIEKPTYLDGRENLGACRHELIEAHRLLGDALEAENARTTPSKP